MSAAVDLFTIVAVSAGGFFFLAGTVGLLRFPDTLTRLHALTKADNLGLGLVVLGLLPRAGGAAGALGLVCVWLIVLLGSAAASQLIARAVRNEGPGSPSPCWSSPILRRRWPPSRPRTWRRRASAIR
jgi:multicomponent Na+:H+ antiporter subunit G